MERQTFSSLQTISEVSREYGISPRMLRYYEQVGLIQSSRKDDYAYRVYDENAINRLKQIIVLRKLRISVKQIVCILNNADAAEAVEIFERNISQIDDEITALSTVKALLARFVDELRRKANISLNLLEDEAMHSIIGSLSFPDNQINKRKEDLSMEELNNASRKINKLTDKNVRIINIPPSDVASYRCEGMNPEDEATAVMTKFVKDNNLVEIKPDIRHFGFNAPNPKDETGYHGYEMWVTIPDGFDVPLPLTKKHMDGGLYCAHMIPMGAFDEWSLLEEWMKRSEKYEYNGKGSPSNMFDSFEEWINYAGFINNGDSDNQLDLLIPIRKKG